MITGEEDGKTGRSQEVDERPVPRLLVWHQQNRQFLISFRRLESPESKKDKLRNQMDLGSSRLMKKRLTEDLILHVISTRSIMRASAVVTADCGRVAAILFFLSTVKEPRLRVVQ